MRAVIQRAAEGEVRVEGSTAGKIRKGLVIFLGVEKGDNQNDIEYLSGKITRLRVFEDNSGRMNLNISDSEGEILVISQFTLLADCRKGNRPSFENAAPPDEARSLYLKFIEKLKDHDIKVSSGEFGKHMDVYLVNSGPVTIILDSKKRF